MNYRTPSYGGWLSLVFTLVLSSISGVADIAFQIKRLPIQPEQEGASVGDFHINGPGNVLWVEGVPSNGSTFTYNIYRPTGAPNPIDDVQRIPGPVSEPGGILGFNDTDNFIVNIPGLLNLDHRVYRWNGGSYVPLSDPNPLVQPPGRLLSSAGITGLANSGAALGLYDARNSPHNGIYTWSLTGSPVKLYDLPSGGYRFHAGPSPLGTCLVGTASSNYAYQRAGGISIIPVPTDQSYHLALNDKDQVAGTGTTQSWIYLPAPDYGLPEGLTIFEQFTNIVLTNSSTLIAFARGLPDTWIYDDGAWQRMVVTDPEDPNFPINPGLVVLGASSKGDILAISSDQHGNSTFLFERIDRGFIVEIILPTSYQQIAEANDVLVKVTSTIQDPITISFPEGLLSSTDTGALTVIPPTVSPFILTANAPSRTFTAQVIPRKIGRVEIKTTAQATIGGSLNTVGATATVTGRLDLGDAGGFESQALGTMVTSPPDIVSDDAIAGWRVFDVDSANVTFSATVDGNASEGEHSLRLTVNNTGGSSSYALDQWNPLMHTPVEQGTNYVVSFDASWISGATTNNLFFQVQEFDSSGGFVGTGFFARPSVSSISYQKHAFLYRPVNANTAQVGLFFSPMLGMVGSTSIQIDSVDMKAAPPVTNGTFELSPIETTSGGTGAFVDSTTFVNWRLFSVGSPPITSLNATIVDAGDYTGGQAGSQAVRLDVNNTASPASFDYGFDNDNARISVITGNKYMLSFDLALDRLVGGPINFQATIAEFDASGAFTGTQTGHSLTLPLDGSFHHYTFDYTVTNAATTQVGIAFRPITTGESTLALANVDFISYVLAYVRSSSDIQTLWIGDQDGDGLPFGLEFALGMDPFVADASSDRMPTWIPANNQIVFGYDSNAAEFGSWVVQRSVDLNSFEDLFTYNGRTQTTTVNSNGVFVRKEGVGNAGMLTAMDYSNPNAERFFYRVVARLFHN